MTVEESESVSHCFDFGRIIETLKRGKRKRKRENRDGENLGVTTNVVLGIGI